MLAEYTPCEINPYYHFVILVRYITKLCILMKEVRLLYLYIYCMVHKKRWSKKLTVIVSYSFSPVCLPFFPKYYVHYIPFFSSIDYARKHKHLYRYRRRSRLFGGIVQTMLMFICISSFIYYSVQFSLMSTTTGKGSGDNSINIFEINTPLLSSRPDSFVTSSTALSRNILES